MSVKNPDKAASVVLVEPRPQMDSRADEIDAHAIMTSVGEAAYEWTIADDKMRWDTNAISVLGIASLEAISTGRAFAALIDPASTASRGDVILNGRLADDGCGVRYELQYALLPDGPRGRRLMVEEVGRWYVDAKGQPERCCGVVRIVTERYEREQRLEFLSRYDELTGYLNRAYLLSTLGEALAGAARTRTAIAFMIVAVDNFQAINEAYGFEVADQMFATVARRIKASLRDGDAIGRLSGNKLGVIVQNCGERDMHVAAERFHGAVRNEVVITEGGSVAATVSIGGVALPRHGRSVNEALARAEEALHNARRRGHGHFFAYAHSRERAEQRRANAELSSDLVAAFNRHQFVLGYQPVVHAGTREPAFHEALVRLQRPNNPVCEAGDFVVLAERLGLIRLIDQRVLELVLDALSAARGARLSFNISAETVGDGEWLSRLAGRVAGAKYFAENRLIVEITETALMRNLEEATRFVALMRDLGCEVALDDFGAGFSSFRSLRDLGVDMVKIDGGFVEKLSSSPDDQAFVRALIDLASNLGIKTVAERVQDERTAVMLTGWGVDYLQGNFTGAAAMGWPAAGD